MAGGIDQHAPPVRRRLEIRLPCTDVHSRRHVGLEILRSEIQMQLLALGTVRP